MYKRQVLHDAPQKRSIKALYRAKRPLTLVMPTTIFPREDSEFDFLNSLRPSEPDKWVAAHPLTGEPEDFLLHWAKDDTPLAGGPARAPPKRRPAEPKPLTAAELGNSAVFGRAPRLAEPQAPRAVPSAEFFGRAPD